MTIKLSITVDLNISDLPEPRPFDIEQGVRLGCLTLCDPMVDEDEGGTGMKDIEARWPCESNEAMSYCIWFHSYALPMLAAGGCLRMQVQTDEVRAGLHQAFRGDDPRAFLAIKQNALAAQAGAKLEAIKAIVNGGDHA